MFLITDKILHLVTSQEILFFQNVDWFSKTRPVIHERKHDDDENRNLVDK